MKTLATSQSSLEGLEFDEGVTRLPWRVFLSIALYTVLPNWLCLALGWVTMSDASRFRPLTLVFEICVYLSGVYFLFSSIRQNVLPSLSRITAGVYASGLIFFPWPPLPITGEIWGRLEPFTKWRWF